MLKFRKFEKSIGVMAACAILFVAIITVVPTVSASLVLAPPWNSNYVCDNTQPSTVQWVKDYSSYNWITPAYCVPTAGFVGAHMSATAYRWGEVTMTSQPGLRLLNWRAPQTGYLPVTANWHLHTGVSGDATYGHPNTVDVSIKVDLKIVFTDRTTGGTWTNQITVYQAQLMGGQKWTSVQIGNTDYSVTTFANMNRGDSITIDTWVIIKLFVDGGSIYPSKMCSGSFCMKSSDPFYGGWLTSVVIG